MLYRTLPLVTRLLGLGQRGEWPLLVVDEHVEQRLPVLHLESLTGADPRAVLPHDDEVAVEVALARCPCLLGTATASLSGLFGGWRTRSDLVLALGLRSQKESQDRAGDKLGDSQDGPVLY